MLAGRDAPPERRDRVASLSGAPAARRLYREVAADLAAPLRVDLVGPGGSGKTVLLDALAALYRSAGVTVLLESGRHGGVPPSLPGDGAGDAVLLLDDAQQLPPGTLDRLAELAGAERTRLVVAHRPWPRTPEMTALGAVLSAARSPVVLGPLDRAGVAARATMLLGARPEDDRLDLACDLTGGLPLLVDRLLTAWRDTGEQGLPDGVIEQLRYDLHRLPDAVRELLVAIAAGAPADLDVLAPLLGVDPDAAADLIDAGEATGLLAGDGTLRPMIEQALLRLTPKAQLLELRRRLAETQLARGGPVLAAAQHLLGSRVTGARAAAVFEAAGDEALRVSSPAAGAMFTAAVEAGASTTGLAARRAEAAAAAGDLDGALELTDRTLTDPTANLAERARAVTVAAAVMARRGLLARSAELYRWLATQGDVGVLAVPAFVGTGALEDARAVLDQAEGGAAQPPTLRAAAESLLARGVYDAVTGSPTAALAALARSATMLERSAPAAVLPDTPAALAALVALHAGELDVARSVLDRAVAAGLGGPTMLARHQLLSAWVALQRGSDETARELLARVSAAPGGLAPADELIAAALGIALARRTGDLPPLRAAWPRAREALVQHPVDLFMLGSLGELAVAAARLGEQHWVGPHLDDAWALLAGLGDPPLWTAPLHWSALQAALAAGDADEAEGHAAALREAAPASRHAAALAAAADHWLRLSAGDVDGDAVAAAARGLHAAGLGWEGARLAGQAAIRTRDRRAMVALLDCARTLQQSEEEPLTAATPAAQGAARGGGAAHGGGRATGGGGRGGGTAHAQDRPRLQRAARSGTGGLSEREGEIAKRVLAGLTYKQIGQQLYISPKTVEHHIAQLRRRYNAASRSELFAHLRDRLGGPDQA